MTETAKLLDVKKNLKKKRPDFMREGSQNSVRIGDKWRRPKGLHSKMRHQFAGHRKKVNVGFMSPSKIRGLDKEGFALIKIEKIVDLNSLDPKVHKIIISSNVGMKNKILLLEKASEKGFKIFACKDPVKKIAEFNDKLKSLKDAKTKKSKVKKEKKDLAKKEKKKAELEEKVTVEEKKKEEKKEMEKVITKRG